jgi:hypothetical protein
MERDRVTKYFRFAAIAAATLSLGTGMASAETPAERALRNLELLRTGAKTLSDLSEIERRELAAAERLAREGNIVDRRTPRKLRRRGSETRRPKAERARHAGDRPQMQPALRKKTASVL